ncbi:molybdopterin-dependent oxidoreductase [Gordonia sp. zg691]|uniref:Molybdopterin-dependent oxidoreductase n=1 Tax=Gordonia jinghuaiqii TaxID=2758710 RepID=A0A7D7QXL9_9ACTN|nr:molybdopterin-dependent oxidoreductase [Gordonia jinghuaiqii]MBD0860600.1 molybdopterin-dependent oxidoreductase [Gordonia jinghuaiqii]MCR5978135.1 molybdopterin-dependent oxidoreductase [Gordonia jinghuaiqii]QMT01408.1 molybdopterin-dependent oxidoreductase [Gordonia jinghuaiqii]
MTSIPKLRTPSIAPEVSGVVAVGAALAVGELAAVPVSPDASPYFAVGSTVVDSTPEAVREWAIETFGTSDKVALYVGMGVIIALLAAASGYLERRRPPLGSVIIAVFGVLGVLAAVNRPGASWTYAIPSIIAGVVGVVVLRILLAQLGPNRSREAAVVDDEPEPAARAPLSRRFVLTAAGIAAAAVAVGVVGRRMLADTADTVADRARLLLPKPAVPAPPIPPGAELDLSGATPFVTDNADFYRIDTALQVPTLTTSEWRLRIHGDVDKEVTLSWDDLLAMPMTERVVTLACVSNDVGGDLVGNASWLGVPMRAVLDLAGVRPGADMLLSTSVDGWTCGTPISALTDGRDALLAVGMNGSPLPIEHGYPVRQVVPGLYGYVSATKWVVDWEITRFSDAKAYWTTRGWSALGPIKMASRFDRPADGTEHPAGEVIIAGTAWAQHTGIERVEVRVDQGPWQPAELTTEYSIDTWRQWRFPWQATKGEHTLECRAIDKLGRPQIERYQSPAPDGASGLDDRGYTIT